MTSLPVDRHLVIGLGSGRSGTASLTSLIDRQNGGICFHEMNPSCATFSGNPQSHVNAVREFRQLLMGGDRSWLSIDYSRPASVATYGRLQTLPEVRLIGDIAYYYLNYVKELLDVVPECRFVCIKRDREETVASWLKKSTIRRWPTLWLADRFKSFVTRTPFYTSYNYWQEHDGSIWKQDPMWDNSFPKLQAATKTEAIRRYWDYYYLEADRLQREYPENFRVFDIAELSDAEGQHRILSFIGIDLQRMVYGDEVHLHRSVGS